jgi:hypothetical protein
VARGAELSWVQHGMIRKHRRESRVAGGLEDSLWRSRLELHEMWLNPLARRNRSLDPRALTRYAGLTASSPWRNEHTVVPPATLVAAEEVVAQGSEDVPEFDTFDMA